jgi:hypothetical protein
MDEKDGPEGSHDTFINDFSIIVAILDNIRLLLAILDNNDIPQYSLVLFKVQPISKPRSLYKLINFVNPTSHQYERQ